LDDGGGEGGFFALEEADLFFDRAFGQQAVGDHGLRLADAVDAIDGLRFRSRVPPRVVEDRVACSREVQAETGGFQRQQENRLARIGLEPINQLGAVFGRSGQEEMADAAGDQAVADEVQHFHELAEDEDLVAFLGEFFDAFEQRFEFGAGQLGVRGVDQRGVAADLA